MTTSRIYAIVIRDYEAGGTYDEQIIGVTEDVELANEIATKECNHQVEDYNLKVADERRTSFNGVIFNLVTSNGQKTKVFVKKVNLFTRG